MYLRGIQLVNVKGFSSLDFDFARPDGTYPGWNVVVGGNSAGKTALLKATSPTRCLTGTPPAAW
jgi:predicted ATP-binding protein involved in virulence